MKGGCSSRAPSCRPRACRSIFPASRVHRAGCARSPRSLLRRFGAPCLRLHGNLHEMMRGALRSWSVFDSFRAPPRAPKEVPSWAVIYQLCRHAVEAAGTKQSELDETLARWDQRLAPIGGEPHPRPLGRTRELAPAARVAPLVEELGLEHIRHRRRRRAGVVVGTRGGGGARSREGVAVEERGGAGLGLGAPRHERNGLAEHVHHDAPLAARGWAYRTRSLSPRRPLAHCAQRHFRFPATVCGSHHRSRPYVRSSCMTSSGQASATPGSSTA